MTVPWTLPENLARIRKARDLSQEQLAASAGVAVDTVARIERAERQTTRPSTVNKLAAALGVAPSVLLGILRRHAARMCLVSRSYVTPLPPARRFPGWTTSQSRSR